MPSAFAARFTAVCASAAVVCAAGCGERAGQSALHPAGPAAAQIALVWWVMCAAFAAVFVLVVALLVAALLKRPEGSASRASKQEGPAPPLGATGFIVAGGIVLPVVVLVPILFLSLETSAELALPRDAPTVRVIGHMWWWEIEYPGQGIVTANEIHIPAGEPVRLELTSADVIHSFWVPSLNGKRDLIPGMTNTFWIEANEPGIYRGQCGEYCGTQHANMVLNVVAVPADQFAAWVAERRGGPSGAADPLLQRGQQAFRAAGCADCHTIRGTSAAGRVGPDLTHFGSRQTIGGILANTRGNLTGWIADPQPLKPGIKMPRSYLSPEDLHAVAAYLESLQ